VVHTRCTSSGPIFLDAGKPAGLICRISKRAAVCFFAVLLKFRIVLESKHPFASRLRTRFHELRMGALLAHLLRARLDVFGIGIASTQAFTARSYEGWIILPFEHSLYVCSLEFGISIESLRVLPCRFSSLRRAEMFAPPLGVRFSEF